MAIDTIPNVFRPNIACRMPDANRGIPLPTGCYRVTYSPSSSTLSLGFPDGTTASLAGGTGIITHANAGSVFASASTSPMHIMFEFLDSEIR